MSAGRPVAAALTVLGAWAVRFSLCVVYAGVALGGVGLLRRRRGCPLAPMVLGILVGKLADTSLRRALLTYSADLSAMLTRPIGLILLALLLLTVIAQYRAMTKKKD